MKTRIKVVKRNSGNVEYVPQYKCLFWWECFVNSWRVNDGIYSFDKEKECRDFLDQEIEKARREKDWVDKSIIAKKVKSITYLKHPKD